MARQYPLLILFAACLAPASAYGQRSVDDFLLGGTAAIINPECIRLTPDQPYVSGSAWFKGAIDLGRPFEMRMSLVLGEKDQEGADGIVFVFHPTIRTGFRGEGMGFAGLRPSLGIEFDTYRNMHLNDPDDDHLALMVNGRSYHHRVSIGDGPVKLANLEDGVRHPLRITWDPKGRVLRIFLDGALKASYEADLVKQVFGGRPTVFWGMTAGTGRLSNDQIVCIEKVVFEV